MNLALQKLMEKQFSLFTREQAMTSGYSASAISQSLRSGRWIKVRKAVYQLPGTTASWKKDLLALQLAAGPDSAVSCRSAAVLLKLEGFKEEHLEVTTPLSRVRIVDQATTVHRTEGFRAGEVARLGPFRVTSFRRTLVDLAGLVAEESLEIAVCDALRREAVTIEGLAAFLDSHTQERLRGAAALRRTLASVDPKGLRSSMEVLLSRLLRRAKLFPLAEFKLCHEGKVIAELDFAFPEVMVGIECDGHAYHVQRKDFVRNLGRYNGIALTDWKVLRFTWGEIRFHPEAVADRVKAAILSRKSTSVQKSYV